MCSWNISSYLCILLRQQAGKNVNVINPGLGELLNLTMHMHRTMVPKRLSVVICTPIFKPLSILHVALYSHHH